MRVSKDAGLGRIEVTKGLGAILQRDEGIVALVDLRNPFSARVLGRYDDGAEDSLDGDLAFSSDGQWLFYARQTERFSNDGVHVLDVSDPTQPRLATYQPGGGTFRIGYFKAGDGTEYVIVLDAIDGLVINRFVRETGALIKVFQDAEPALKVGGPASAGLFIDRNDPMTGRPLLYVTTGRTGLQIYDITLPESPEIIGKWSDVGLAEVEVVATRTKRTVFAATEYWFNEQLKPEVHVLDATKLDAIRRTARWSLGLPPDNLWRVQGMDRHRGNLFVAYSHAGVVAFDRSGVVRRSAASPFRQHEDAGATGSVHAMDVELRRPYIFVTDAATGRLVIMTRPGARGSHG
ncbi:MAG: hypothetical protein M3238_00595 [Actinomycetota bacterium]|nr:hypothetical protein [Actinomycetota bacterium]